MHTARPDPRLARVIDFRPYESESPIDVAGGLAIGFALLVLTPLLDPQALRRVRPMGAAEPA